MKYRLKEAIDNLKKIKPLVLNVTNSVTMDFVANTLIALGACPLMSQSVEEIRELVGICSAVTINIGTLNKDFLNLAAQAIDEAYSLGYPIILDPVGAGASKMRTHAALDILPKATIIKGNASEILALANQSSKTRGVDACHSTEVALEAAEKLAKLYQSIIVVSGEKDYVVSNNRIESVSYGSPLMSKVTGMGCALTGVIAAFSSSMESHFNAAYYGSMYFALCGQKAAEESSLPGSYKVAFIDQLYDFHTKFEEFDYV